MITTYLLPILSEADKSYPLYVVTVGAEYPQLLCNRPDGIEHHQLHFSLNGTGRIKLNGKLLDIKKNDILYLKPGTPQYYYPTSNAWNVMWITFAQHKAYDILQLDNGIYSLANIEPFTNVLSLMLKDAGTVHFSRNASVLLYSLLLELKECLKNVNYFEHRSKLQMAVDFIEKNYSEQLSVSYLADLSNMSQDHFCRLFKQRYHMRPLEYIKKLRMQDAKNKLLSNPDMSVAQIADSVGYNSPSHFIKSFREIEGATPLEFRNSLYDRDIN